MSEGPIQTIQMLNRLATAKEPLQRAHIRRVVELAQSVGRKMSLGEKEMRARELASDGVGILEGSELFRDALPGILHHHEHFDGSGYPARLAGRGIPLVARIITVVDAYDAMTGDRPYRRALSEHDAWVELIDGVGSQFCPDTVVALADVAGTRVQVPRNPGARFLGEKAS